MTKIQTGKGTISVMALMAIWSISLVVNLPGLAISPLLAKLPQIFPGTSQFEVQLLTIIPNLMIIPFVILSGRLAESRSKISILTIALLIYLASGVLYFFASSMTELIAVGALLGLGCGLVIPLAASLLADTFTGKQRMQQLGIKSGIANISLVAATLAVGMLEGDNWRLPFLVYLIPIVPLALSIYLPRTKTTSTPIPTPTHTTNGNNTGLNIRKLIGLMGLYFFICYATVTVAYNLPFLSEKYNVSNIELGVITSLFFFMIFLPGIALGWIIGKLKQRVSFISLLSIAVGLMVVAIGENSLVFGIGVSLMGFGVGILQPIIYDKSVQCATHERKTTLALSFVLATNYVAVSLSPVLIDGSAMLMGVSANDVFPFAFNAILALVVALAAIILRGSFVFRMEPSYIGSKEQ